MNIVQGENVRNVTVIYMKMNMEKHIVKIAVIWNILLRDEIIAIHISQKENVRK